MIELGKAHSTQANFTLSGVELAVPDTYTFLAPDAFDDIPIDVFRDGQATMEAEHAGKPIIGANQ